MYEIGLVLLGFCAGLLVKFTFAAATRSNVQPGVISSNPLGGSDLSKRTVTLPKTRKTFDLGQMPKPSLRKVE